ncbi:MAG: methylated-DNA--[Bacteroidaceae bacterium]|nr:methylated-DNA--[protein]-cysteine S-methyltransferase [Bacteroidaceae bacterium]
MSNAIYLQPYASPCGPLVLGSYQDELCLCDWGESLPRPTVEKRIQRYLKATFFHEETDIISLAKTQLDEYFNHQRTVFTLPLLFVGTPMQQKIWEMLPTIAYGHTLSYAQLAQKAGQPQSVRAVANAIGANALSIIIPCHRILGSNHSLTGYAGGLAAKEFLLSLEQQP